MMRQNSYKLTVPTEQGKQHLEAVSLGGCLAGGGVQDVVDELGVAAELAQRVDGRQRGRLGLARRRAAQQALRRVGAQEVLVQVPLQLGRSAAHHLHHLDITHTASNPRWLA